MTILYRLEYYTSEDMPALVTLSGSKFVIDVEFGDNGNIIKAQIISATTVNLSDARSQSLLTEFFVKRNLDGFKDNLTLLSFLDRFSGTENIDLFQCMKQVQNDVEFIYELELQSHSQVDVLFHGHGIARIHKGSWGPSIAFWCHPKTVSDILSILLSSSLISQLHLISYVFFSVDRL